MQSTMLQQPAMKVASSMPRLQRPRLTQRLAGRVQSQSGRSEPFNEGAVQVQRLVNRDRAQMLGNKVDILDKFETEFGDPNDETSTSVRPVAAAAASAAVADAPPASTSSSSSNGAAAATPSAPAAAAPAAPKPAAAAAPAAVKTTFGGSSGGVASPFGAATSGPGGRSRSSMEPKGLSPDMSPDPIVKLAPTPGNIISRITLTQVVLFCTFSSMIGLMLATFSVVVKSGAVRLAGIE